MNHIDITLSAVCPPDAYYFQLKLPQKNPMRKNKIEAIMKVVTVIEDIRAAPSVTTSDTQVP